VRRSEFQLNDSAEYFFENVERTTRPNYVPTDDDILRCRVKTTGISETVLKVGELRYRLLDVGGQRTERRKWLACFEDVTVLLFLVAINEFDQSLYEDESVNRLQESVTLFESVANSRYFAISAIILFMNKIDLFAARSTSSPPSSRRGHSSKTTCLTTLGRTSTSRLRALWARSSRRCTGRRTRSTNTLHARPTRSRLARCSSA